ncbi:hypothetical protein F2Q69_00020421 [Brassica cretica]|uniref:Uncharacterized protein n=1 Tax=Brassica cretica TaxID=69181 RepID=A0A8S9Q3R5_BRACR|nr:hypothetical protein F2Q69_00020421 [Brassica cretica]
MVFIISKSGLAMAKSLILAAKNVDSFIIGDKMVTHTIKNNALNILLVAANDGDCTFYQLITESVFRFKYVLKNYGDYGAFRGAELHICVRGLSMDGGLTFQFHRFEVHMTHLRPLVRLLISAAAERRRSKSDYATVTVTLPDGCGYRVFRTRNLADSSRSLGNYLVVKHLRPLVRLLISAAAERRRSKSDYATVTVTLPDDCGYR